MIATFFKTATNLSTPQNFLIVDPAIATQNGRLKTLNSLLNLIKTHLVSQLGTVDQVTNFRVMVYCETRESVAKTTAFLRDNNWGAQEMSGDLCSQERKWLLHQYRNGDLPILVCTKVAITECPDKELPPCSIVIMADTPKCIEHFERLVKQASIHSFILSARNEELLVRLIKTSKVSQIKLI